jgi:hypothetical protein
MSTHPLTDALPDHMDALALRQACGEIEERVTRERDDLLRADSRWSEIVADELAESRRLMDLGGAKDDENFTTFAERVIAERDALRAEVESLRKLLAEVARQCLRNGGIADELLSAIDAALTPAEVKHD